ncbi:ATP-binding cassette subfamily C protein CydC [Tahibacter aquaticus]|uniref:ATP-binding cassette subfamily C protein CydC n=2 Tax=Tahibacter aquaticus TaxID=520092 RepID=A0A4R6Z0N4_9GAMM|nr:ATP-binding cassette subfamily C protein CydC [Tahibacter aquaticus]
MMPQKKGLSLLIMLRSQARPLLLAALLSVLGLGAAAGLVAYSGSFITATAIAGAAAGAVAFDIFRPGAIIRLLALVRTTARYGERVIGHDAVLRLLAQLRCAVFAQLSVLAPLPLARWSEGDLLQRLVGDIDTLDESPLRAALPLLGSSTIAGGVVVLALVLDLRLGLMAAAGLSAAAAIVPALVARQGAQQSRQLLAQTALRRERLVDALRGLTTLSLCGAWSNWRSAWQAQDDQLVRLQLQQRLREALGQAATVLLLGATAWLLLAATPAAALPPTARVGLVLAVVASLEAVAGASGALLAWARARAAQARIGELLQQAPAVVFPAVATLPPARGALELHQLAYTSAGRNSGLAALSLSLPAGTRLLVRAPSGAGKSTLLALLSRQLAAQHGELLLDGRALADYDEASLRQRIACLPQRPHLFAASLAENLRLADPAASDARLHEVLHAVDLGAWLQRLPAGLDTPIGEYGLGLSGGEARRVALACCLLRPAVLYLLDEPFEGLDAATRTRVAAGIGHWIGGATLVVCSHHAVELGATGQLLVLQAR